MALRTRMTSKKDGGKHTVTLSVALTEGSKADADIEITWGPNDLGYPEGISPAGGVASTTKVSWAEQLITAAPREFVVTLHCATAGEHTVDALAKVHGGSEYPDATQVDC